MSQLIPHYTRESAKSGNISKLVINFHLTSKLISIRYPTQHEFIFTFNIFFSCQSLSQICFFCLKTRYFNVFQKVMVQFSPEKSLIFFSLHMAYILPRIPWIFPYFSHGKTAFFCGFHRKICGIWASAWWNDGESCAGPWAPSRSSTDRFPTWTMEICNMYTCI